MTRLDVTHHSGMGFFATSEQSELSRDLMSLANAYLQELSGNTGFYAARIETLQSRLDALAVRIRLDKGPKGLAKPKREAMSYLWTQLTADPTTSFRDGSPAKVAHDLFETELERLVPNTIEA